MGLQSFIFSNKLLYCLARHLAFWSIFYFYTVLNDLTALTLPVVFSAETYTTAAHEAVLYLPVFLFSVYVSIYFILPRYLAAKKLPFLFVTSFLLVVVALVAAYAIADFDCTISHLDCTQWDLVDMAVQRSIWELFTITGAALTLKILKEYTLRQRESEALVIESVRNNIRLLKMRLHPRILFACLRSIAADVEAGTLQAPDMILKLADLLSYLLYDSEMKSVPLHKALKMMQNYGDLKKLQYKENLDLQFKVTGEIGSYDITPGLFLPLLEIALAPTEFLNNKVSVSIEISVVASTLYFDFESTSQEAAINVQAAQQTLDSTRKKLELFYSPKFKLETYLAPGSFTIRLQLELEKSAIGLYQNLENEAPLFYKLT